MGTNTANDANWDEVAFQAQKVYFGWFGDRVFDQVDRALIWKKVGCALYGFPTKDAISGYLPEQQENVLKMTDRILSLYKDDTYITIACIYVHFKTDKGTGAIPIFKTSVHGCEHTFIEPGTLRVYKGFDDFLKNNRLPACRMCYPKDGTYRQVNGNVCVEYGKSPASFIGVRVMNAVASTATLVGSGICILGSVFIPALAPALVPAAVTVFGGLSYKSARACINLYDIGTHGGSICPTDNPEALEQWIEIGTSLTTSLSIGRLVGKQLGVSKVLFSSITSVSVDVVVNSVYFLMCLSKLVYKFMHDELELGDIVEFGFACFFIANIIISSNIAESLINEILQIGLSDSNLFKMVTNADFAYIKRTLVCNSYTQICKLKQLILGFKSDFASRLVNYKNFDIAVKELGECWKQYKANNIDIGVVINKSLHSLSILAWDGKEEFERIIEPFRKFFNETYWRSVHVHDEFLFEDSSPSVIQPVIPLIQDIFESISDPDESIKREIISLLNGIFESKRVKSDIEYIRLMSFILTEIRDQIQRNGGSNSAPGRVLREMKNNLTNLLWEYSRYNDTGDDNVKNEDVIYRNENGVKLQFFDIDCFRFTEDYLYDQAYKIMQVRCWQWDIRDDNIRVMIHENRILILHYISTFTLESDSVFGFGIVINT